MSINDGKKGFTVRMDPALLLRAKKLKSMTQLRTEKDVTLNQIIVTALENECKRANI